MLKKVNLNVCVRLKFSFDNENDQIHCTVWFNEFEKDGGTNVIILRDEDMFSKDFLKSESLPILENKNLFNQLMLIKQITTDYKDQSYYILRESLHGTRLEFEIAKTGLSNGASIYSNSTEDPRSIEDLGLFKEVDNIAFDVEASSTFKEKFHCELDGFTME